MKLTEKQDEMECVYKKWKLKKQNRLKLHLLSIVKR